MLNKLKQLADQSGIDVIMLNNVDFGGCYLPEYDVIYLNANLDDQAMIYTFAHELGHAAEQKNQQELYNASSTCHAKMELEAELGALHAVIDYFYSCVDVDLEAVNIIKFMDLYEIDYSLENYVKDAIGDYYRVSNAG